MNEIQNTTGQRAYEEISILDILRLLIKKIFWIILSGACVGLISFLILTFLVAPTYESTVRFYVYNSTSSTPQSGTIDTNDLQAAESLATTYSKILESNSVLNAVLDDIGNKITRKELSQMMSVSVVDKTQLLEVVISSTDADFACKVARSFTNVAPDEIVRITKAGGVEVVDSPEVAREKSSPRTIFDTAVAILLGMILAAVAVIWRTISDRTIYLPEDIEKLTGKTILGQIPEIDAAAKEYTYWTIVQGGVIHNEKTETARKE